MGHDDSVRVEAESTAVASTLEALFDVLRDAGAEMHPGIRIRHVDGQLDVWADGDEPWLMRIPTSTLVPISGLTWADDPPLRLTSPPQDLTDLQRSVLHACIDVMVAAGTWEHVRATHPRATITDEESIEILRSLHPAFTPSRSADAMLRTRTIRIAIGEDEPSSFLMPMLDFVNHHPDAPAYASSAGWLSIPTWRAQADGQCFVSYGSTRDALGIALAYGYVDEAITRVTALPGTHELPRGHLLHLRRASRHRVEEQPHALIITGAAFDARDPRLHKHTIIDPVTAFLSARGLSALTARHAARVVTRRIADDDAKRLRQAVSDLGDRAEVGCAVHGIDHQLATLMRTGLTRQ